MRAIKFRGKAIVGDKTHKKGQFVAGNLIYKCGIPAIYIDREDAVSDIVLLVDPATVGQFTGLRDKTGKDLYEGDILRWFKNRTKVVRWFLDGWTAGNDITSMSLADLLKKADCEIVGNIHDNPKLLKEE